MWVQYKNKEGKTKKINLPKNTVPAKTFTDSELEIWELDDPKYQTQEENTKDQTTQLVGFAILIKDAITGLKQWATYAADGSKHTNLSPQQPLVIPVESKLQLGTRIEIRTPL